MVVTWTRMFVADAWVSDVLLREAVDNPLPGIFRSLVERVKASLRAAGWGDDDLRQLTLTATLEEDKERAMQVAGVHCHALHLLHPNPFPRFRLFRWLP